MKRIVFDVAIVVAAAIGLAYAVSPTPNSGPVYLTAKVERGKVTTTVTATGTVKAVATVEVGSQLSGQIDELFVDFNDEVSQGQPIARLDQRSFLAKVREAEAALDAAKASVAIQEAAIERARSEVAAARARVKVYKAKAARAQAVFEAADRNFKRYQALQKGISSIRQMDEAKAARDTAAADFSEAQAANSVHAQEIESVAAALHKADAELLNARATVAQREAALVLAKVELDRSVIRSPITGVVIGRDIDKGQTVAASLEAPTLFKIARDLRDMEVHAKIDEADIGRIRVSQPATFRVDAFPERQFNGKVAQIRKAPEVVKNVVTYRVVITTRNPELLLLPGMTALVEIVVRETDEVLRLPNAALRFRPRETDALGQAGKDVVLQGASRQEPEIWVLGDSGKATSVRVRVGLSDATVTEVIEGPLREGQDVVVGTAPEEGKRRLFGIRWGF